MHPVGENSDGLPKENGAFPAAIRDTAASPLRRAASDRSLLLYTALAVGIAVAVRLFIAAPYLVSGPSMEPTFQNHDYLIVDRFSYGVCLPSIPLLRASMPCIPVGDPKRGDIVIFKLPQNTGETLIKRVIGIPGDTVSVQGTKVIITNAQHPRGYALSEPYLDPADLGGASGMTIALSKDQFFVMGDNRKVSFDSRFWGTLPRRDIIGRVFVRLYPFDKIGILPGEARYSSL